MWSLFDRGSPLITVRARVRPGPLSSDTRPVKLAAWVKVNRLLVTQRIGCVGVDRGSKAIPVMSRSPVRVSMVVAGGWGAPAASSGERRGWAPGRAPQRARAGAQAGGG